MWTGAPSTLRTGEGEYTAYTDLADVRGGLGSPLIWGKVDPKKTDTMGREGPDSFQHTPRENPTIISPLCAMLTFIIEAGRGHGGP